MSRLTRTREEHLEWCKERAHEYLPADPRQAVMSFNSDVAAHPETNTLANKQMCMSMILSKDIDNPEVVRRFIDGFR